jgi:hypothetical protein
MAKPNTPDGQPMQDEPDQKERVAEQARIFREEKAERDREKASNGGRR